jgi:hypothetical protein
MDVKRNPNVTDLTGYDIVGYRIADELVVFVYDTKYMRVSATVWTFPEQRQRKYEQG